MNVVVDMAIVNASQTQVIGAMLNVRKKRNGMIKRFFGLYAFRDFRCSRKVVSSFFMGVYSGDSYGGGSRGYGYGDRDRGDRYGGSRYIYIYI